MAKQKTVLDHIQDGVQSGLVHRETWKTSDGHSHSKTTVTPSMKGATAGAAVGAVFGPIGAVIGALIGGIFGAAGE